MPSAAPHVFPSSRLTCIAVAGNRCVSTISPERSRVKCGQCPGKPESTTPPQVRPPSVLRAKCRGTLSPRNAARTVPSRSSMTSVSASSRTPLSFPIGMGEPQVLPKSVDRSTPPWAVPPSSRYTPKRHVPSDNVRTGADTAQPGANTRCVGSQDQPPSRDATSAVSNSTLPPAACRYGKNEHTTVPSRSWAMCGSRSSSGPSYNTRGSDHVRPSSSDRTMQMRPPRGQSARGSETWP